jgi:hypothetical protein
MGFSIFMHDLILCIICEPILCAGGEINIIIIIIIKIQNIKNQPLWSNNKPRLSFLFSVLP